MLFVINVGWQRKKHKFMVQMMRAPYEIGEEIRGRLLKILQTKRNKMGRKSAPMLTSYTETGSVLIPPLLYFCFCKIDGECCKQNYPKHLPSCIQKLQFSSLQ